MAPKPPNMRFISVLLCFLLSLWYIPKGTKALPETRLASYSKRFVAENATIAPRENFGGESTLRLLSERAAPQNVAEGAQKGQGLMCLARDVDVNGRLASEFTDDDLERWYVSKPYGMSNGDLSATGRSISTALGALGLPQKIGDQGLKGFNYVQEEFYEKNGGLEGPGYGYFIGVMSSKAGYISAEDNRSSLDYTGLSGPALNRLSDIYFLIWQRMAASKELRNIKYFVRHHVINTASLEIAKEAAGQDIPYWPGKKFDMTTPSGQAILATPNGVGVAWFLINHKEELGVKVPKSVTVFKTLGTDEKGNPQDWIHFIFEIGAPSKKKGKK